MKIYLSISRFQFIPALVKHGALVLCISAVYVFLQLAVFSYGISDLTAKQIHDLTWKESWEFLVHTRI